MNLVLDTHVWIWWLTADTRLPRAERAALDSMAERQELGLSAISMWEAQVLHAKGRLSLPIPFSEWLTRAAANDIVQVLPLDIDVVLALDELPASFHGDPADRLIVATARAHAMPLATHDSTIRKSRVARLWRP